MQTKLFLVLTCALGTAAFAHSGVQNAAVKKRMDAMSGIGAEMKTLGNMAKGQSAFDPAVARAALAAIADHAAATPDLFAAQEDDPKSEAKPEIWSDFSAFTAESRAMEAVARDLSTSLTSAQALPAALGALGATCKSCHARFRE